RTSASLPPGVPPGCLGPRLVVWLGWLTGIHRVSRRGAAALLAQRTGAKFSLGVWSAREGDLTAALAPACAEIQRQVRADPVCHSDETSWWEQGERRWCWMLRGRSGIFYPILEARSRAAWEAVLGRPAPPAVAAEEAPPRRRSRGRPRS
ncbi:MAG: transposase, partial [Armatimonadetes bacterium]|nr:transposase [Armatimonadota bacterium]